MTLLLIYNNNLFIIGTVASTFLVCLVPILFGKYVKIDLKNLESIKTKTQQQEIIYKCLKNKENILA